MQIKIPSIFVLLLVLCTGVILGQTSSGSITGTVVDPQEAAVANATIKITEQGKSYTLTASSDSEGRFVFPIVPPGLYTITIEAAGFKKQERKDVTLVASDKLSLGNLSLEIGAPTETVNVTTEATLVQSDSGERSFAIQGEQLRNTGIKTRNFISFATLAPGVVANTGAGDGTVTDSAQLSVNGVRSNSNNVQIDGVTSVDVGNNSSNSRIPLESVGEFKLLTAAYSAEFGRSAGAQIIAVTRSGSKDFHGSAYYYRRHTGLNANTFDNNRNNRTRPISDQEEKGYTIGGPVYIPGFFNTEKNKLFFFWNQEWAPRTTPNTVRNVRVPTALERNGDFSQSRNTNGAVATFPKDPLITGTCTSANTVANPGACFIDGGVLHKIPQARWYSLGQKILSLYPLPNYSPVGSENFNYVTQFSNTEINRNDTVRIDYNFNQNWRISGRFLNNNAADTNVYQGLFNDFDMIAGNLGIYGMSRQTPKKSFAGTLSGTLSPTMMLEITYGLNDTQYNGTTFNNGSGPDYTRTATGLSGLPLVYPNAVVDDILSGFTFGSVLGPGPNYRTQRAPQNYSGKTNDISGSLSKVWGDHVTKVGVAYHWANKTQTNRVDKNGVINFGESVNNIFDTGTGFSNALLGVYQTYTQSSSGITGLYKYFNLEPYFQDNWKITKKLTLDYGIRFSWMPPAYDASQNVTNFDPSKWSAAQAPRIYVPVCINGAASCTGGNNTANRRAVDPALLAAGTPLTLANTLLDSVFVGRIVPNSGNLANGLVTVDGALANDSGVQIAPRFGFAYSATEKMVIRGGFGIFYDRPQGNLVYDFNQNIPNTFTSVYDFGLLSQLSTSVATINVPTIKAMEMNPKIPSTNSYNFGIQYKLPFDTVIDVSYVGSQGHHLPRTRQLNETPYGSAFLPQNQDLTSTSTSTVPGAKALNANFYRPYRGFAGIGLVEFSENSNYNSIQISADRRFSRGLTIRANYTGSLARGITSSDQGTGRFDGNDKINYGRLAFHRPHNFGLSWVYELPGITKNRFVGLVTNGWQLSGLYRYQSGEPEQVSCGVSGYGGVNFTGSSAGEGRCVVIGLKQPGGGDEYNLYNYRAFAAPSVGGTGVEATRDQLLIKAPPINNWDLSLSKKFFIWESFRLEARLDAFNALNHTQVGFINFFSQQYAAPGSSTLTTTPASPTNRGGMGAAGGFRPNRTLQWSMRFEF